ncbi:family 16 glycoside hydrolase [Kitasatospora sp. NPDC001664]
MTVTTGQPPVRAAGPAPPGRPSGLRTALVAVLLALAAVATAVLAGPARPGFTTWPEGSVHGPWVAVFNGEGTVGARGDLLVLAPRPATVPDETHAALVVSTETRSDLTLSLGVRTAEQLRTPTPNTWETAWVVWHYTDPRHFYYLALKPTGWELGKEDPAYPGHQRFLATGPPQYPVGRWHTVEVRQRGDTVTVLVDRHRLVTFTDTERPYPEGRYGLYTEDARAEFRHVVAG